MRTRLWRSSHRLGRARCRRTTGPFRAGDDTTNAPTAWSAQQVAPRTHSSYPSDLWWMGLVPNPFESVGDAGQGPNELEPVVN